MTDRSGRCLCGQVTFRIDADPVISRICWCRDCQHLAGNGTVNAIFPSDAIQVSGDTAAYTSAADSGNQITRRFCPRCGSHLFADSSGRPGLTVVRLGTLDDPSSVRPVANIWAASAPDWACLDPALARIEHQPPAPRPAGT
ncbi:MAG: GFA family protein [Rubrivivax sp.]